MHLYGPKILTFIHYHIISLSHHICSGQSGKRLKQNFQNKNDNYSSFHMRLSRNVFYEAVKLVLVQQTRGSLNLECLVRKIDARVFYFLDIFWCLFDCIPLKGALGDSDSLCDTFDVESILLIFC